MQSSGADGRVPVFVFPQSLSFFVGDRNTHKQILTLYNPYEFRITYKILSNHQICFEVEPAKGVVYSQCAVDIVVTRCNLSLTTARNTDSLRVLVYEEGSTQVIGKRDIPATLQAGVPAHASGGEAERFESVRGHENIGERDNPDPRPGGNPPQQPFVHAYKGPSLLLVAGALVCVLGLLMPTYGEDVSESVPLYMHLSSSIKIVIAFVLGLLTYAILRPI